MVDFKNFFQLKQNEDRLGFVNIPLNTDVELYIDPLVLSNQKGAWFVEANNLIVDFFEEVLLAIRNNDDKRALYLYDRFNIPSLAKAGVKFSDDILKKKEFFETLKDRSLIIFRNNINNIEKRNNPSIIEDRVKKYYEYILSLYSSDYDMFTCYREILDNPSQIVNWDKNFSYLFDFDILDTK